jgi:hypothetical protein
MLPRNKVILQTEHHLVIGFTENLKIVTGYKYYTLAVLNTSKITIGHTRSSQSIRVFTSCYLLAAFSGGHSLLSRFLNCSRPQLSVSRTRLTMT